MPRCTGKGKAAAAACDSSSLADGDAEDGDAEDGDAEDSDYGTSEPVRAPPAQLDLSIPRLPARPPQEVAELLKDLDERETQGLLSFGTITMLATIKRLMAQKTWSLFILRYDEGAKRPHETNKGGVAFYSEKKLTRWELVEDLLNLAVLHQQVVEEYGRDYELCWSKSSTIQRIDERMGVFMEDVMRRGRTRFQGKLPRVLVVREWHRKGTWETLSASRVVPQEDLVEEREEEVGYPLRIW